MRPKCLRRVSDHRSTLIPTPSSRYLLGWDLVECDVAGGTLCSKIDRPKLPLKLVSTLVRRSLQKAIFATNKLRVR